MGTLILNLFYFTSVWICEVFISVNCEALSLCFKLFYIKKYSFIFANKEGQANRDNRENVVHVSILMTLSACKYNRTTNINAHTIHAYIYTHHEAQRYLSELVKAVAVCCLKCSAEKKWRGITREFTASLFPLHLWPQPHSVDVCMFVIYPSFH